MRRNVVLAVVVFSALLWGGAELTAETLDREVIWFDADHKLALFVPQALFDGEKPSVPLPAWAYTPLRDSVIRARMREDGEVQCASAPHDFAESPSPTAPPLWDSLARVDVVLAGEVVAVVPGWSVWTHDAVTAVWLRVTEVISGSAPGMAAGQLTAILVDDAEIRITGVVLCSRRPGFHVPVAGDRLLVGASRTTHDARLVSARTIFPIVDGEVVAQPYRDVAPFKRLRVTDLKGAIRASRGEVQR